MTTKQQDLPMGGELDADTKQAMQDDPTVAADGLSQSVDATGKGAPKPKQPKPNQPAKPKRGTLVIPTTSGETQLRAIISELKDTIARQISAEPKTKEFDEFTSGIAIAFANNSDLYRCSPETIARAIKEYALSGVRLGGGAVADCYFVPRKSHCCFQLSYGGMLKIAKRSGVIVRHICRTVHEGDEFDYQDDLTPWVKHKQTGTDRTDPNKISHVYALFKLADGDKYLMVMTKAEIEEHKRKTVRTSGDDTPWKKWPIPMMMKTCIRKPFLRREIVLDDEHQEIIERDVIADGTDLALPAPTKSKADEL